MYENSFEDGLSYLFKNTVSVKPRELTPFEKGNGLLHICLERYIQKETQQLLKNENSIEVKCSYITSKEEKLFNEVLFDLLFDPEYIFNTEIYVVIEKYTKFANMTIEEVSQILNGLTMINIEIRGDDNDPLLISAVFPGFETGNCFNTETGNYDSKDQYFALRVNPDFLSACLEIKENM